jgi:hypothetical protein
MVTSAPDGRAQIGQFQDLASRDETHSHEQGDGNVGRSWSKLERLAERGLVLWTIGQAAEEVELDQRCRQQIRRVEAVAKTVEGGRISAGQGRKHGRSVTHSSRP